MDNELKRSNRRQRINIERDKLKIEVVDMRDLKISIIGAGSAIFSLRLVGDLCRTKDLSNSLVSLMDIDSERLDAVYALATRYARLLGSGLRFEKTADLRKSIEGADFVINTALVGGHAEQAKMRAIGEKHGYYRGIDAQEFNMVSDYFTLTNTGQFNYFLKIAHTIEELVPNAYFLLASNPVFEGTNLISRASGVKVVGFCHGHEGVKDIFKVLDMNEKDVDWQVAGFNHNIWLTRFRYRGADGYKFLDSWIERESENWKPEDPFDVQLSPGVIDMYRFYGKIPIGDAARNGSWKYNYNDEVKKKWYGEPWGGADSSEGWAWYQKRLARSTAKTEEMARDENYDLLKEFPPEKMSGEQHIPFIDAIVNNNGVRLVLNIRNSGPEGDLIIPSFPKEVIIEVPVWVDSSGIKPEKIDPAIPKRIVNMYLTPRWMRMEWAIEAYLSRDISILKEFLYRDPRTKSEEQVEGVIRDIALSNPAFKEHYGL